MSSRSLTIDPVLAEPVDPEVVADPLQQFADSHYESLSAALEKRNGGYFHECCFAFSSRYYTHHSTHPSDSTVRVSKLFKEHKIDTKDRFVEVLRELFASSSAPNPPPAPLFNQPHPQAEHLGKRSPIHQPVQPDLLQLQDQLSELQDQLQQERERSEHLEALLAARTAENNKLHFSLKLNWVDLDALLAGRQPPDDPIYHTPIVYNYKGILPDFPVPPRSHPHWLEFAPLVNRGEIRSEEELSEFISSLPPLTQPRRRRPPN